MRVAHLLPLIGPHEHAGLTGLFGEAVVDVWDDGERCASRVADAHIHPVVSVKEANSAMKK